MGCDQSTVSAVSSKLPDGGRQSSPSMGCDQSAVLEVISVLESELESSKVTCLLGHMGLGESTYLLGASPGWPSTGVSVLGDQPADTFCGSLNNHGFLSAFCFLTASNCPITSGYHAIHERWSGSVTLYVLPA